MLISTYVHVHVYVLGGHEDVKEVERSPPSSWHANANVVGANVGPETNEHEYKSLVIPADKTKKPKPMGPCKDTSDHEVRADKTKKPPPMGPCRDTREVLNEVVDHSKEINAMLNHHTRGTVHFGISNKCFVEEGLDLPQDDLIDKLQTRVGQLLERFNPPVQSRFVDIRPVNLVNSSGEPTGRWRFDICVTPHDSEFVFMSDNVAYYRQGGNSHMVTAYIMKQLQMRGSRSDDVGGLNLTRTCVHALAVVFLYALFILVLKTIKL